jgi:hypothetical protein
MSLGPIIWIKMSEVMTDKGTSVAFSLNLLFSTLIAILFSLINVSNNDIVGWIFLSFGLFSLMVINFRLMLL